MAHRRLNEQQVTDQLNSHAQAVLLHRRAIDETRKIQKNKSPPDQLLNAQIIQDWQGALKSWHNVWMDEDFWKNVESRADELGKTDRRLKTSDVAEIHDGLPLALLCINAKFASEDLRLNSAERAAQHFRLALYSGFPLDTVKEAFSQLLNPLKVKITDELKDVQDRFQKDDTIAKPLFTELVNNIEPVLVKITMIDPTGELSIDSIKDDYSELIRSLAISYINKTYDANTAVTMLEAALNAAASASVRKRLEDELQTVRQMVPSVTEKFSVNNDVDPSDQPICWFCGDQPADPKVSKVVPMHRGSRNKTLRIPRCGHCDTQHKLVGGAKALAVLIFFGLAVLIYFVLPNILSVTLDLYMIAIAIIPSALIVAYVLYRFIRIVNIRRYCHYYHVRPARNEGKFYQYPLYQAAVADGYSFGKSYSKKRHR